MKAQRKCSLKANSNAIRFKMSLFDLPAFWNAFFGGDKWGLEPIWVWGRSGPPRQIKTCASTKHYAVKIY